MTPASKLAWAVIATLALVAIMLWPWEQTRPEPEELSPVIVEQPTEVMPEPKVEPEVVVPVSPVKKEIKEPPKQETVVPVPKKRPPVKLEKKAKPKPEPTKTELKKKREKISNEGPDLPWPCWLVRQQAAGKSDAELEARAKANNIKLTPKQRRQATICIHGK